jgi:uncharacterized protein (TIGR00369 family)
VADTVNSAERFEPLHEDTVRRWDRFLRPDRVFFPTFVGLRLEEVRRGYARLRLPHRPEVCQAAGLIHGGAIATLLDTTSIPAVATFYDLDPEMVTVTLTINFCGAVRGQDAVAEAWVEQGGRSMTFVKAEARAADGTLAATASSVFRIRPGSAAG